MSEPKLCPICGAARADHDSPCAFHTEYWPPRILAKLVRRLQFGPFRDEEEK